MNDAEIRKLIATSTSQVFSINPDHKDTIQKQQLDEAFREAKRTLQRRQPVTIIVLKP
jgi:hypothetical protein